MEKKQSDNRFPDWESLYENTSVQNLPWYNEKLDADLEDELKMRGIKEGRLLDLGTGPGTQAVELSKRGFDVTGADLSKSAIEKARKLANNKVKLIVDDILNSKLKSDSFDYVFDRGCFHVLPIKQRQKYVQEIKRILSDGGILFLKCMSDKEKRREIPFRFSEKEIADIFEKEFEIERIKQTVYQGTLNPLPRALFVVLKKK